MPAMICHPLNVVELELLFTTYWSGAPVRYDMSEQHNEAGHRLIAAEVVTPFKTHELKITDAGKFYVLHLLTIPYPESKTVFYIPDA